MTHSMKEKIEKTEEVTYIRKANKRKADTDTQNKEFMVHLK